MSPNAKHTPGPWMLDSAFPDMDGYKIRGGSLAFRKGPRLIAVVKNQGERPIVEDSLSDARLISAAPDLLEACKKSLGAILTEIDLNGVAGPLDKAIPFLTSAIAKAEAAQ